MEIRRVEETDGSRLREVHLRMYADASDAFSETLAEAEAMSMAQWDARAERFGSALDAVAFVALEDDAIVGFIIGFVGRFRAGAMRWDVDDTVTLARAWVAPAVRRRGVGRALAGAVKDWARERGARTLETQVTENNEPAVRFYMELGFAETGRREPLRSNPTLPIHFLTQSL